MINKKAKVANKRTTFSQEELQEILAAKAEQDSTAMIFIGVYVVFNVLAFVLALFNNYEHVSWLLTIFFALFWLPFSLFLLGLFIRPYRLHRKVLSPTNSPDEFVEHFSQEEVIDVY